MDDDVLGQVSHVDKCLIAHITLVWTDVVMVTNVIGQLAGLDEPVPGGMIKYKRKKERNSYLFISFVFVNQTHHRIFTKVRVLHNVITY